MCQCFSLQWFAVVKVKTDGTWQGGLHRQFGEDVYRLLCEKLHTQTGDLIIFTAGKHTNAVRVSFVFFFCVCPSKFPPVVHFMLRKTFNYNCSQMRVFLSSHMMER